MSRRRRRSVEDWEQFLPRRHDVFTRIAGRHLQPETVVPARHAAEQTAHTAAAALETALLVLRLAARRVHAVAVVAATAAAIATAVDAVVVCSGVNATAAAGDTSVGIGMMLLLLLLAIVSPRHPLLHRKVVVIMRRR